MPIIWIMAHMNDTDQDFDLCEFFGFTSSEPLDLGELPSCEECGGEKEWHPNGHMSHCTQCGAEYIL